MCSLEELNKMTEEYRTWSLEAKLEKLEEMREEMRKEHLALKFPPGMGRTPIPFILIMHDEEVQAYYALNSPVEEVKSESQ